MRGGGDNGAEGVGFEEGLSPLQWGRIWEGGSPENVLIFELIMVHSGCQFLQFGCCFTRKITKLLVDKDGP